MRAEAEKVELDYVVIRQYKVGDYDALRRLYLTDWPNANPFRRFEIDNLIRENDLMFIAENGSRILAGVFYTSRDDHAYIHSLLVRREFRKQGIAAEMLKVAEEQAKCDGFSQITITAESDDLVNYYTGLGFRLRENSPKNLVKNVSPRQQDGIFSPHKSNPAP